LAVLVTAGAGTGKTTVLEAVVAKLESVGHKAGQYVVFGKAAADDAERRMQQAEPVPGGLSINTADACARRCLKEAVGVVTEPMDDGEFKTEVLRICRNEIQESVVSKAEGCSTPRLKRLAKTVAHYIIKTLEIFTNSPMSLDEAFNLDAKYPSHTYYPAVLYHNREGSRASMRAPAGVPEYKNPDFKGFYCQQAKRLWELIVAPGSKLSTHAAVMKQAQLRGLAIAGSYLLVDEVQDLTPCQLDWFVQQHKRGTHVFFVGDMAQQINSFRGAKSAPLLEYTAVQELKLTKSFRFGPNVATVANVILFGKINSLQTSVKDVVDGSYVGFGRRAGFRKPHDVPYPKALLWRPYLIEGAGCCAGQVGWAGPDSPMPFPCTLLASTNATLFETCLPTILKSVAEQQAGAPPIKVAVNGRGSGSGLGKWRSVLDQVEHFADLFDKSGPTVDPWAQVTKASLPFKEFEGETELTWNGVCAAIEAEEMTKFQVILRIVLQYQKGTRAVMQQFKEQVIEPEYTQAEADIVLSTVHSAKGMEWENVQLCEDLCTLANIKILECDHKTGRPLDKKTARFQSPRSPRGPFMRPMFDFEDHNDDVNLWYVAVTRAKQRLALPSQFKALVDEYRALVEFARQDGDGTDLIQLNRSPGRADAKFSRGGAKLVEGMQMDPILNLMPAGAGSWQGGGDWEWQGGPAARAATAAGGGGGAAVGTPPAAAPVVDGVAVKRETTHPSAQRAQHMAGVGPRVELAVEKGPKGFGISTDGCVVTGVGGLAEAALPADWSPVDLVGSAIVAVAGQAVATKADILHVVGALPPDTRRVAFVFVLRDKVWTELQFDASANAGVDGYPVRVVTAADRQAEARARAQDLTTSAAKRRRGNE
jgi:hypothetical protein